MHHRRSRLGILATVLTIVAASLAAVGPVTAADTRDVFFGSPGGDDGALTFTGVSSGNATSTRIFIDNNTNATMNKATLTVGTFPATALPSGLTVAGAYAFGGGSCSVAGDGSSATCLLGNIRGKTGDRTVIVVLNVSATAGTISLPATLDSGHFALKVNETVNDNGANRDTFFAGGSIAVGETTCDSVATFVAPGQSQPVSTESGTCNPQSTTLSIPSLQYGAAVQITEEADTSCAGTLKCFGQASRANVNDGASVNLLWTITWDNANLPNGFNVRKAGVIHFLDAVNGGGTVIIPNTNAGQCGNNANKTNCIVSFEKGDTTTTVIFRTPSNGKIKGFG